MVLISLSPMELDRQRNLDDLENGCRSLGSEYLPSGQSRKISIGIMAEDGKLRSRDIKEDVAAVKNIKKDASVKKVVDENNNISEMVVSLKGQQGENMDQKASPWVLPKSFSPKQPTAITVQFYTKKTSFLNSGDGVQKKFNRVNETPKSTVVQLFAKQSLVYESSNGLQKKFDGVAYGKSTQKGGNTERVEEFAFAAAQEVHVSEERDGEENKENRVIQNKGSLKQKLWEALETAPSQSEKISDSKAFEVETENANPDKNLIAKRSRAVKSKQNSDSIETDSESPDISIKRPVTRSLTRKKTSTASHPKLKCTKGKGGNLATMLSNKQRHQENNIFTFNEAEEKSGSLYRTSDTSSLWNSGRWSSALKPRKIFSSAKRSPGKTKQCTDRGERPLAANKTVSHDCRVEKSHSNPSENKREHLQSINGPAKEGHHLSKSNMKNQQKDVSSEELPKKSSPEDLLSGSSKKDTNSQYGADSPTLRMKTTMKTSFFDQPSPKSATMEQVVENLAPGKRRFTTQGFYSLRTLKKPKRGSSGSNAKSDSSDDSQELKESPVPESSPIVEEMDATHRSSQSSEDQEEKTLEKVKPNKKGRRVTGMVAGSDNLEKSSLVIRPRKRLRNDGLISASPSQKGAEEINELLQLSNQNEDGLTRVVALFALALERIKTRIHIHTSKKSSEILASLSEEIQLQLQNVNSQIQKDVLKFTNLGKSKRKSLEARFQEQQERLKSMHDDFKEEVAQHLQECTGTLEDLKTFQIELKGDAKKRKASHEKLLLLAEEAIGTQLSDADRRITSIHKGAKKTLFQLQQVIAESLKDGVFD